MKTSSRLIGMCVVLLFAALACQLASRPAPKSGNPTSASASTASSPPSAPASPTNSGVSPVNLPPTRLDQAGDVNSASNAHSKMVSGGDVFVQGLYERPFNANTMDTYFSYIDIIDTRGFMDDTWGYATITLEAADANGHLPAQYAVELDLNKDGRGDWLIRASNPSSTTWSTQGVQAWKDTDGDIGGVVAMVADNKPRGGDGYETLVFDQGKGALTDGAWARIDPNDPTTVQIAFKLSMLGNPPSFTMGAWAGTNVDPAMFDYNDHMTHVQAGDPDTGYPTYPIKALAEVDNTCRLAIGFVPTSKVPGLCQTAAPQAKAGCTPSFAGIAALPCP
ncbi:MAG TPA: hypothetical protein VLZ89_09970 [Anaerolineales bacterium]|nr:hypothetical protein [Anaerolineales bacterium]